MRSGRKEDRPDYLLSPSPEKYIAQPIIRKKITQFVKKINDTFLTTMGTFFIVRTFPRANMSIFLQNST